MKDWADRRAEKILKSVRYDGQTIAAALADALREFSMPYQQCNTCKRFNENEHHCDNCHWEPAR